MAAGSPSSATVPNFNPDEYRPPLHAFEPVGLKLYKPKATIYDDEVVLRDPEIHFSVKNREPKEEYIKVFGGSGKVKQWYEKLPQRAKELVDGTGFGVFVQLLGDTTSDHFELIALAERWWDTTNTLHLPFGEATLTPLDFAAITGIWVGGHPIPFDMELYRNRNALAYFLGQVPYVIDAGTVRNSWFYETFKDYTCVTERDHEHVTRAFLLYLFGVALFPSKDGRVHLHYLAAMKDLSTIRDYDWGGAALATLYGHMGAISRGTTQSIGGYWRVLEIWSYEFLRMHVPRNSFSDPSVIPRGLKWVRPSKGKKERGRDFTTYRLFLDQLTKEQVNWDVWAGLDPVAHADLLRSRQANGRRILLEGPFCRQWYLGERVVRQSLGYDFFVVPKPIPVSMLRTRSLTIEDVGHWTEGEDAAIFLEEFGDYEEYRAQRLMSVLGVRIVQRGPPLGSQVRAVPTAVVAGGGAEVLVGGVLAELPKLSWQVDCYSSTGHIRYVDIPSPEHVDFTLPPSVQQVPREYAEAWFRHISGLRVLVRQQVMAGKTVRPPVMVEGSSFVVAGRGTMTGTCEDKASPSARTGEQPITSTPPQTPPQIPISWPSDSIPSLNWIMTFQNAFEWGSRNLAPHKFPTIFPATELCKMIESAASILMQESNCIQIDGLGADSVVVVGDVHGQLHDVIFLLRDAGFPGDNRVFVFNGDYVDRGAWGLETFLLLLAWKVAMPTKVFLLRGNHETRYCTKNYGFKQEVLTKYGGEGDAIYDKFLNCFGRLPLASVIAGRVYTAHGGLFRSMATISSKKRKKTRKIIQEGSLVLGSIEELNKANRKYPSPPRRGANLIPNDVLWSDPSMSPGLSLNEGRGVGLLWGPDCTEDFLKKFNLTLIIRSHEGPDARAKRDDLGGMDNGYTIDHVGESGKLITLFSAPDYPQFQDTEEEGRYKNKGAYIVLEPPHFDSPVFHSFEAVTPRPQANPYYDYKNAIDSNEELDFASMES